MAAFIVLVSICEAFVTWQAAVVSNRASDLDTEAMQQLLLRQRESASIQGSVAQDFRLFERFQEHAMSWTLLKQQAAKARKDGLSVLADDLAGQARGELANARSLQRLGTVEVPNLPSGSDGVVDFDPRALIRSLEQDDDSILGVHPRAAFEAAATEHDRAVHLVGLAALLAASLLFLTLAQLGRRVSRHVYAVAGAAVWATVMVLFAVIEAAG